MTSDEPVRPGRRRHLAIIALAIASTAGAARLIIGHIYPGEGPSIALSATHGIHVADLVVLAVWSFIVYRLHRWW